MIADVIAFERVTEGGVHAIDVKCDPGGDAIVTAEHFAGAGDDAPPLPGDSVALTEGPGAGRILVSGYLDPKNAGVAAGGERRVYARNAAGTVVAEIWLKGGGDIEIKSIASGGKVTINGVEIDQQGNIRAPGEVTAMTVGPGVKLSTHLHPTAMGPSSAPTPGT